MIVTPALSLRVDVDAIIGGCPQCRGDVRLDFEGHGICERCFKVWRVAFITQLSAVKP